MQMHCASRITGGLFLIHFYFIFKQRMLSRQEELKERARVLLEQARRDAALKAGNRQLSSSTISGRSKQPNDVRNIGHHGC